MTNVAKNSVVSALPDLFAIARKHAGDAERERNLPTAVAEAFGTAGVFRMCRPQTLGGLEADPLTTISVIEELARGDGSAGWCAMLSGPSSNMWDGFIAAEGSAEMFADPRVITGGVGAPVGRALEVDGGFQISGRWPMASNCRQCVWLGLGCLIADGDLPPRGAVLAYLPAADCKILDTWDVCGLRGTGSNDVEVVDVFVPTRRCVRFPIGPQTQPGALYKFPFFGFQAVIIAAAALGVARAAIDEYLQVAKMKNLGSRTAAQLVYVEAESAWNAGRALLYKSVNDAWNVVEAGKTNTPRQRAMLRLSATNATTMSARAVDLMYTAGGSTSLYAKSPLQRHFRDIHAITQHSTVAPATNELIGKILLGVEADAMLL